MSDRIAVFNGGRIEQVGTAHEVYERPASAFVAGFVGSSNVLVGDVARRLVGDEAAVSVRPERVRVGADVEGDVLADGVVSEVVDSGATSRVLVRLDAGADMSALVQNSGAAAQPVPDRGARVRVAVMRADLYRLATPDPDEAGARTGVPDPQIEDTDDRVRGAATQGGQG
jgi:putative spermidine/putrescine transport system ATP-binding protein